MSDSVYRLTARLNGGPWIRKRPPGADNPPSLMPRAMASAPSFPTSLPPRSRRVSPPLQIGVKKRGQIKVAFAKNLTVTFRERLFPLNAEDLVSGLAFVAFESFKVWRWVHSLDVSVAHPPLASDCAIDVAPLSPIPLSDRSMSPPAPTSDRAFANTSAPSSLKSLLWHSTG